MYCSDCLKKNYAVTIHHISARYEKIPVITGVTTHIPDGKLVAVIGPNGAGKTTLIKAMLGLIKPFTGEVFFFGTPYEQNYKSIAYVPQKATIDWDFPVTVLDVVLMGRYPHLGWFKRPGEKDYKLAHEALKTVGLTAHTHTPIGALSGGQQQRVFLARALAQQATILFLDEPFIGIDAVTETIILDVFKTLQQQGMTIVVIHHDLQTVQNHFDWVIFINGTCIAAGPTETTFTQNIVSQTYQAKKMVSPSEGLPHDL